MAKETTTAMETTHGDNLPESTRPGRVFTPPVDIFENEKAITVLADMPGVAAKDLDVDLNEGVLTITGHAFEPEREGELAVLREYGTGTFQRKFTLSQTIDQEKIEAKLVDGVLHLELPKQDKAKPRKIKVGMS